MFDCHLLESYSQRRGEKGSKFGIPVSMIHGIRGLLQGGGTPNRKELTRREWSAVVSMLVAMKTEDGREELALWLSPKNLAWHTASMHELGIINSPEFISLGKTLEEGLCSRLSLFKFMVGCLDHTKCLDSK